MTGVYQIINEINNKRYIGSSIDIDHRYRTHLSTLRNNSHSNKKLQYAVNKYGIDKFHLQYLEECDSNELLIIEQKHIDNVDKDLLYNLTFVTGAGGYDTLEVPVYLLDLDGNIIDKFKSQMEFARSFNTRIKNTATINTGSIFRRKYRVVTIDFYNNNIEEIKSWKSYTCEITETSRIFKLKQCTTVEVNNIKKEFNNREEVSQFLGLTIERVRQIIKSGYHKKYKIYYTYPELHR